MSLTSLAAAAAAGAAAAAAAAAAVYRSTGMVRGLCALHTAPGLV
jgi:hypothetical protein